MITIKGAEKIRLSIKRTVSMNSWNRRLLYNDVDSSITIFLLRIKSIWTVHVTVNSFMMNRNSIFSLGRSRNIVKGLTILRLSKGRLSGGIFIKGGLRGYKSWFEIVFEWIGDFYFWALSTGSTFFECFISIFAAFVSADFFPLLGSS